MLKNAGCVVVVVGLMMGVLSRPALGGDVAVRAFGAIPGDAAGDSEAINKAVRACDPGDRLIFESGVYDLLKSIEIGDRRDLEVIGNGAVLMLRGFDRHQGGPTFSAIRLLSSVNVRIEGFSIDMDVSPNSAGEIVAVGDGFLDVRLFDEFSVTGEEFVDHIMTFHRDYRPNGRNLDAYRRFEVQKIADRVLRLTVPGVKGVTPGEYLCLYHKVYGGAAIYVGDSDRCSLYDVTVLAFAGMGLVVTDRSTNVTLQRYRVQRPAGSQRLTSTNADGSKFIHTGGLLTVRDGSYEGMGDDAINIHSSYGRVGALDRQNGTLRMGSARRGSGGNQRPRPISPRYVIPGDRIEFYDATTLLPKGIARVTARTDDEITLDTLPQDVAADDLFNNLTMTPAVRISDVTVRRNRARGFLLQAQDVVVEDCRFENPAGVGIFVTTDVAYWYESGPGKDVVIRNNTIIGANKHLIREGAITVKCGHDAGGTDQPAGVHRNIRIEGNTITDTSGAGIFVCATDGIRITGNTIKRCSQDPVLPSGHCAVFLQNCKNAFVADNTVHEGDQPLGSLNCAFLDR